MPPVLEEMFAQFQWAAQLMGDLAMLEHNCCCHVNLQPQAELYHWGLQQLIAWACPLLVYATEYFLSCFILFSVVSCLDLSELIPIHFWYCFIFFPVNLYAGHPEDHYWAKSIAFYASAWKSLYLFSVYSSSQSDHFLELLFFIDLFVPRSYIPSQVTAVWFLGV